MPLTGTNVLITGAARRIGRAIAVAMAAAGARVAVHYGRSASEAAELVAELTRLAPAGPAPLSIQADLMDGDARRALIPRLLEQGFPVNCLINNASVYRRRALATISPIDFRHDYEINFTAPFELMQAFAVHCRAGTIINLLDQRVATVDPSAGAYGLAKKSLRDATEAAALQWAPAIRVNAVAPGLVLPPPGVAPEKMQPLLDSVPLRRASTPREVALACVFLASADTITGQILFVDGGLHLAPLPRETAGLDLGLAAGATAPACPPRN